MRVFSDTMQRFMTKTFTATLATIIIALLVAFKGAVLYPQLAHMTWVAIILLGIVWMLVTWFTQVIAPKSIILGIIGLAASGVVAGIFMTSIFVYVPSAIVFQALASTVVLFLFLIMIGVLTPFDLTKYSTIFYVALIVEIIVYLINVLIFHSGIITIIASGISIIVFSFFTARDMQYVKYLGDQVNEYNENGFAINAAMSLFLDFYNLFMSILRILMELNHN